MFEEMKDEYESTLKRGVGTWGAQLEYLRVRIGRALISHLSNRLAEARERWNDARKSAEVCKDIVTGFIPAIIDCCVSDVDMKLTELPEANAFRIRARESLEKVEREYWWTGLGTFVIDWLQVSV